MDDRIQDKWTKDSRQKALEILYKKFLTPEGREWFESQIRAPSVNKDHVQEVLSRFAEMIEEHKQVDDPLLVCETVSVATSIIQAAMASTLFRREKNSWEN